MRHESGGRLGIVGLGPVCLTCDAGPGASAVTREAPHGPDRDEAFGRDHDLVAWGRNQPGPSTGASVISVLDAFLDWCQRHQAPRTFVWYRDYLQPFARAGIGANQH